ncbi:hypothetical protein HK101_007446 [Irineochytrium annulatum]|nr:hypothetical protein HK101_007446 [Irineochytrium annulatum]
MASKGASKVVSTCLEGTVLKNINIYAGKPDIVAKADDQYPAWLWELLEKSNAPKREWQPHEYLQPKYLRTLNLQKIRSNRLAKRK